MKTTLKNISETEIEISCEISTDSFEKERPLALKKIGDEVTLPGFRKGHIPEAMLVQKFGDALILEEMANIAIDRAFPEILKEHKVASIGMPTVKVMKLAKGNPFEFTLTFPVMPEIKLPDYKKIAREIMNKTDGINSAIVTSHAPQKQGADSDSSETYTEYGEEKSQASVTKHMGMREELRATDEEVAKATNELLKQFATKDADGKEVLPELTLDVAHKFGPFTTVEEFTAKIRESISHEKENRVRGKKRMQAMEKIADEIKVKLPHVLIDGELQRMMGQFRQDIMQMGMKLEDYLKTIKKSEEDLRKEWLPDAEKRAKIQIALSRIAEAEKLEVPKEVLEKEVAFFLERYKDADHARATLHLEMILMNEKVFQFLEGQK